MLVFCNFASCRRVNTGVLEGPSVVMTALQYFSTSVSLGI